MKEYRDQLTDDMLKPWWEAPREIGLPDDTIAVFGGVFYIYQGGQWLPTGETEPPSTPVEFEGVWLRQLNVWPPPDSEMQRNREVYLWRPPPWDELEEYVERWLSMKGERVTLDPALLAAGPEHQSARDPRMKVDATRRHDLAVDIMDNRGDTHDDGKCWVCQQREADHKRQEGK